LGAERRLKTLTVKIVDYVLRIIYKSLGNGSSFSGQGPVAGSCEYGDEPSGSGATELVKYSKATVVYKVTVEAMLFKVIIITMWSKVTLS
jgi:hypothetical protein